MLANRIDTHTCKQNCNGIEQNLKSSLPTRIIQPCFTSGLAMQISCSCLHPSNISANQSLANQNNNHHQLLFHLIYLIFSCKTVFAHSVFVTLEFWPNTHLFCGTTEEEGWQNWLVAVLVLDKNTASPQIVSNYLRMQCHLGVTRYTFRLGNGI